VRLSQTRLPGSTEGAVFCINRAEPRQVPARHDIHPPIVLLPALQDRAHPPEPDKRLERHHHERALRQERLVADAVSPNVWTRWRLRHLLSTETNRAGPAKLSQISSKKRGAKLQLWRHALAQLTLTLGFCTASVSAGALTFDKVVATNRHLMLGHYAMVFENCSLQGMVEVRIIQRPMHGSITKKEMVNFGCFVGSHAHCNNRKVMGTTMTYSSSADNARA
jgi:hypothetical protein